MINGFTLPDTKTAPAASVEILNGVQKAGPNTESCGA